MIQSWLKGIRRTKKGTRKEKVKEGRGREGMKRKSKGKDNQKEGNGKGVERPECKEDSMYFFVNPLSSDDSFLWQE